MIIEIYRSFYMKRMIRKKISSYLSSISYLKILITQDYVNYGRSPPIYFKHLYFSSINIVLYYHRIRSSKKKNKMDERQQNKCNPMLAYKFFYS